MKIVTNLVVIVPDLLRQNTLLRFSLLLHLGGNHILGPVESAVHLFGILISGEHVAQVILAVELTGSLGQRAAFSIPLIKQNGFSAAIDPRIARSIRARFLRQFLRSLPPYPLVGPL